MQTILLNSIAELNNKEKESALIAMLIFCTTVILVYWYMWYNEQPNYRMGYNTKTNKWYIEQKGLFGYYVIESYNYREIAEKNCTKLNQLKNK